MPEILNIPIGMRDFGLDNDGVDGASERFDFEVFQRSVKTSIVDIDELSRLAL